MAHSRVCSACGHDTSGTAPFQEPVYGLLLVRCAACSGLMATRRWPGSVEWWRRARRYADALVVLAAQAVAAVGALLVVPMLCMATNMLLRASRLDVMTYVVEGRPGYREAFKQWWKVANPAPFLVLVMAAVVTGCWIGATLRHHRVVRAWAVVTLVQCVMAFLVALVRAILDAGRLNTAGFSEGAGAVIHAAIAGVLSLLATPSGLLAAHGLAATRRAVIKFLVRVERRRRRR